MKLCYPRRMDYLRLVRSNKQMGIDDINTRHDEDLNKTDERLKERVKELHKVAVETPLKPKSASPQPNGEQSNTAQPENAVEE